MTERTVAIVQARMTSTRLPGKVLAELEGAPMLQRQIERLRRARRLDGIALATTTNATDDPVAQLGERLGLLVHRGSEHDVLARFVGAAAEAGADVVVRTTADCPLIDAGVLDEVVAARAASGCDYASNVEPRTYPRGLDVEVVTRDALERCHRVATSTLAREHVTWHIHSEDRQAFTRTSVVNEPDASDLRWTVDTPEDLALVRAVYAGLDLARVDRPYPEVRDWIRARPEVARINALVQQKSS